MLKKDRTYHYDIDGVDTVVTDTLIMAKEFGLKHRNLLIKVRKVMDRQIERQADTSARLTDNNNDRTAESQAHLFVESKFLAENGEYRPKIILTEKAFHHVVSRILYAKGKYSYLV